jgi:hypothetical protein
LRIEMSGAPGGSSIAVGAELDEVKKAMGEGRGERAT